VAEAGAPSARVTAAYSGLIPTSAAIAIRAAEINRVITSSVVLFLIKRNHKENDKPGQSAAKKPDQSDASAMSADGPELPDR